MEFEQNEQALIQNTYQQKNKSFGLVNSNPVMTDIVGTNFQILIPQCETMVTDGKTAYNVQKFFRDLKQNFKQSSKQLKSENHGYLQELNNDIAIALENANDNKEKVEILKKFELKTRDACIGDVVDPIGNSINMSIVEELLQKFFKDKSVMKWFFQNTGTYEQQISAQHRFFTSLLKQPFVKPLIMEDAFRSEANTVKQPDFVRQSCLDIKNLESNARAEARISRLDDGPYKNQQRDLLQIKRMKQQLKKECDDKLVELKLNANKVQMGHMTKRETKFTLKKRNFRAQKDAYQTDEAYEKRLSRPQYYDSETFLFTYPQEAFTGEYGNKVDNRFPGFINKDDTGDYSEEKKNEDDNAGYKERTNNSILQEGADMSNNVPLKRELTYNLANKVYTVVLTKMGIGPGNDQYASIAKLFDIQEQNIINQQVSESRKKAREGQVRRQRSPSKQARIIGQTSTIEDKTVRGNIQGQSKSISKK